MKRLNVLVDSYELKTVAPMLVKLASEYDLTISLEGTLDEVMVRHQEIEQLLMPVIAARKAKESIKYVFGIGADFTKIKSDADQFAFKLHDFGFRGKQ